MSAYPNQKERFALMLETMGVPFTEETAVTRNHISRKVATIITITAVESPRSKVVGRGDAQFGFDKDGNHVRMYIGE